MFPQPNEDYNGRCDCRTYLRSIQPGNVDTVSPTLEPNDSFSVFDDHCLPVLAQRAAGSGELF